MSQAPNFQSKTQAGVYSPMLVDAAGDLAVGVGVSSKLNITAAAVVKVGPGRVGTIINSAGVAGFQINDCATTGAAAAANVIMIISTTTVGQVIKVDFPFTVGLVVSAVGASGILSISYT